MQDSRIVAETPSSEMMTDSKTAPKLNLARLMFGENGIAYILDATLSRRAVILAESVRRRFEEFHDFARGQDILVDKKVKQLAEQRDG